ncbi:penicillin-binding protein [Peribacillus cavernae]|uniref:serine-type D-Ala-D-Ala carboxypeptidase n=1 Tax=Peribacillus cavernae TaxID=1674310 RepID=A0A3S1B890_9BACI|nr:penicillin-binding protein [Peribacillus cavernae]MDQ0217179.1 penicillin-binding protein 2B [Peribacillus cavernae]RUQ30349.1 penicillin-binding protein [Peribacillus cavernae]
MQNKQKNMKSGAALLFLIFGLLFFVLIGRFLYIQVTGTAGGEVLASQVAKKYEKTQTIEAERGTIYDEKGEVIAEDTSSYTLLAVLDKKMTTDPKHPKHVKDPEMTAKKLANYLDIDEQDIYERLTKKGAFQVEFGTAGRDLSNEVKTKIEKLNLPGITFTRDTKRFYPNGVFASHLIGYVERDSKNEKEVIGKLGIERYLNSYLKEEDGKLTYDSDKWGMLLPGREEQISPPKNGKDVTLTIDKKIQTFLEDSITKVQKEYKPKEIIAIVSNPKTGEIVAMAQRPTFHPQTKEGLTDTWHNLAVEESFEPGSTMKTFTLAAAVEEGKFDPNATFTTGSYKVGPSKINDHSGIRRGKQITFLEGVQSSSNVGFATLAMDKIGPDRFREYLTKFGFDKPTGIDLPNEIIGKIQYKYKIEKVTTAFGQGTTVTPIQQIQAASSIANNGKMMKPFVIKEISERNSEKVIKKTNPVVAGEPISPETAKKVREYLGTVITAKKGTGKKYKIDGYEVAGKTGTAQISGPGGRYLTGHNNYTFSFLGMAPKDDPQLVMYVAVKQPQLVGGKGGSDPLSEIFNPVMKSSLQYLNIKPANLKNQGVKKIDDLSEQSVDAAVQQLKSSGYEAVTIGKGDRVVDQAPKAGSMLLEGEKVIIKTDGAMTAPDMHGWSLRDAMKVASLAKLNLNTSGGGYVSKQNLKPGSSIKEGDYCIVELKNPEDLTKQTKKKGEKDEVND